MKDAWWVSFYYGSHVVVIVIKLKKTGDGPIAQNFHYAYHSYPNNLLWSQIYVYMPVLSLSYMADL